MERWRRDEHTLWRAGGGGTLVLLAPDDAEPFVVHGRGAALWAQLEAPHTTDEIAAALSAEFDTDLRQVAHDIEPILHELAARGAVTRHA